MGKNLEQRQDMARFALRRLKQMYPDAHCALVHSNPLQLLVATILSAQCTDARVNLVTPDLFKAYPSAKAFADADLSELEEMIRSTGFFRNKAKSIKAMAQKLVEGYSGQVPDRLEALIELPGVGRKTANVVLGNAFGRAEGIVVDTHVARVSHRLGLTKAKDPVKIEKDLLQVIPRRDWILFPHLMIFHGRQLCKAPKPLCEKCRLAERCPSRRV